MLADDAYGQFPAGRREADGMALDGYEALVPQAVHHLGDRGRGMPDPLTQAGLNNRAALVLEIGDRLDVLLGGRMDTGVVGWMDAWAVTAGWHT